MRSWMGVPEELRRQSDPFITERSEEHCLLAVRGGADGELHDRRWRVAVDGAHGHPLSHLRHNGLSFFRRLRMWSPSALQEVRHPLLGLVPVLLA